MSKTKFKNNMFNTAERDELHKQLEEEVNEERYSFLVDIRDKNKKRPTDENYDPSTLYISETTMSQLKPFEKQYWRIKKDNFDVVIFFAKGKFYELYENDADIGAKEFDWKIANRVNMRMAGVPKPAFKEYASKLLMLGYKVGVVDEMETSEEMKKRGNTIVVNGKREPNIVRRELRRVYTTSTITDIELNKDASDMFCMALVSNGCNVGVCYGDASVGRFFLGFIEDTDLHNNLHTLLHRMHPKEILLTKEIPDEILHICKNLGFAEITTVPVVEDSRNVLNIFNQRGKVPKVIEQFTDNEYVMSALSMIHDYFETLYVPSSTMINGTYGEYQTISQDYLIIDAQSIVNLALFNKNRNDKEGTLLHFIDNCDTAFGKRMLRERFLLKPLMDVHKILKRQEVIKF